MELVRRSQAGASMEELLGATCGEPTTCIVLNCQCKIVHLASLASDYFMNRD